MPLSHVSKVFAVRDAAVRPLLTDPAGGTATYGDRIDVPGIKSVTISGDIEVKELRGDNQLLDSDSTLTNVSVEFEYAKLSLDVLAVLFGNTVTDSGTTPEQIAEWELTNTSQLAPFAFEAISASADTIGGDVMIELFKVVLSSFPELGMAEEDYKTQPLSGSASPRISDGKWVRVALRESAALLGA
jgi:hypothetical protein